MNLYQHLATYLEIFSHRFAKWAGRGSAFLVAISSLIAWFFIGESHAFSNAWENALTIYISVITFLMIFLTQRSQNKELSALHIKLNEIIAATRGADNNIITAEDLSEKEIKAVRKTHHEIVASGDNTLR